MKLMIIPALGFLFAIGLIAQEPVPTSPPQNSTSVQTEAITTDGKKVLLRSDGTWVFAPVDKSGVKIAADGKSAAVLLVTPEHVALFPKEYFDKSVRFSNVKIGDIGSFTDGVQVVYPLEVQSKDGKSFSKNVSQTQGLNFVMGEEMARTLQSKYQTAGKGYLTSYIVNLVVNIKAAEYDQGRYLVFGAVQCIEFLNAKGSVIQWIGNCK